MPLDLTPQDLANLSVAELRELLLLLEEDRRREARRHIWSLYPDTGPLRRELYPRHMEFFKAGGRHEPMIGCPKDCDGSPHQERGFIAANRIGKSKGAGGYETTLHLIGQYPDWWPGYRFDRPITAWAAGEDAKSVRDSIQKIMLGEHGQHGTGLIPGDLIKRKTARGGVPDAIDTVYVETASGGLSSLVLKSYDQGREAFQGAKVDVFWPDEEPPLPIYVEGLTRTMSTVPGEPNGIVLCTFTPLKGISDVVKAFLPGGQMPGAAPPR